jgi:hypothetical protein
LGRRWRSERGGGKKVEKGKTRSGEGGEVEEEEGEGEEGVEEEVGKVGK